MIGIPTNGMGLPGTQPGVGYSDPAADPESRQRTMLAQMLMQQGSQPGGGGWADGLNKVMAGGLAGMQMGQNAQSKQPQPPAGGLPLLPTG